MGGSQSNTSKKMEGIEGPYKGNGSSSPSKPSQINPYNPSKNNQEFALK